MAENRPVTPEKQLLKLIEDPKSSSGAPRASSRGRGGFSLGSLRGILAGRLSFWKRSARSSGPSKPMDLAIINRVLVLAAVGLLVYVSFDVAASAMMLTRPPVVTIASRPVSSATGVQNVSPLKSSAFYLEKIASRDIFKEGPRAPVAQKTTEQPVVKEDVSGQFSLVGISWSSDPDVIIENKEEHRTYFVKRGQPVGGGVKVEAVFKDHVVLSREGQEFDLR